MINLWNWESVELGICRIGNLSNWEFRIGNFVNWEFVELGISNWELRIGNLSNWEFTRKFKSSKNYLLHRLLGFFEKNINEFM